VKPFADISLSPSVSPVKPFADISLSPSGSPVEPTLTTGSPLKTMKPLKSLLSLLILASTSHAKPLELITPRLTYQQRLDHAIKYHAAKEEVKESFIRAWVMRESSGLDNATRYEPHVAKQRETIDRYLTPSQRSAMASSHGPLQVMGYNAKACGLRIADLYDPYKGIGCGIYHLKAWMRLHPRDGERLLKGLANYNGGYKGHTSDRPLSYAKQIYTHY